MPINIISKLFSDGSNEVDLEETVFATVLASSEPFTIDELTDGICAANPQDQEFEDHAWIREQVRHYVTCLSNPAFNPALPISFICDEISDGRYQRREREGRS